MRSMYEPLIALQASAECIYWLKSPVFCLFQIIPDPPSVPVQSPAQGAGWGAALEVHPAEREGEGRLCQADRHLCWSDPRRLEGSGQSLSSFLTIISYDSLIYVFLVMFLLTLNIVNYKTLLITKTHTK